MKIKTPLLREPVANIGVVLFAAGLLDDILRKGDYVHGSILVVVGLLVILISAIGK